jgi:fructokinase
VERPKPQCTAPDDVVLRIAQTGICGTDRGVLVGKFPAKAGVVMGHEAVGEVVETGTGVASLKPGDRVIVNPTLFCGLCEWCRRGELNFCLNKSGNEIGIDRDGAFAEYMRLEERFLFGIPDDMSYDRAVLVEPLTCVLNNLDAAGVRAVDTVAILGGGPIGLLTALAADHVGSRVRLVERDPFRRNLATELFAGIQGCGVEVCAPDAVPEHSFDAVIDAVGNLLERSCLLARNKGRIVVMGFNDKAQTTIRPLEILQRGLTIIGAGDYNSLIFPRAVELARRLPLERLITHRFRLDQHRDALETLGASPAATSGYAGLKVVIEARSAA